MRLPAHAGPALLENANQRIADEIDTLENDYQREQAELAQKHAAQQQRALEAIERKKPEFYREKTLKDRPVPRRHARDPKHPRESGYER